MGPDEIIASYRLEGGAAASKKQATAPAIDTPGYPFAR